MAIRAYVADYSTLPNAAIVTWAGLANTDTGAPFEGGDYSDATLQVFGTFGAGGSVAWEGTNNAANGTPANFGALSSVPAGTAIALTTALPKRAVEMPTFVRPNVTAGDGSTALTMVAVIRRSRI